MGPTRVFKSTFGRVLTIAAAVVAVITLVVLVTDGDAGQLARSAGLVLLGAGAVWALFWRPQVLVSDGEIVLTNVLRTIHVPWPSFRGVDATLSLTVTTTGGTYTAWGVSGSSSKRSLRTRRGASAPRSTAESVATAGASADAAAFQISERHAALVAAGHLSRRHDDIRPTVTWHWSTIVGALMLGAWAAAGIMLG